MERLLYACLAWIVFKFVSLWYSRDQLARWRRLNNAEDAIDLSGPFPWGLNRMKRLLRCRQSGEDILDDILGEEFRISHTFQMTMVEGTNVITTTEPVNLQAMLSTQFRDYDTGKMRHNQFWPVLGRSIFSSDGAFWEHSRALLRPQFARDNINNLSETHRAAELFLRAVGRVDDDGWTDATDVKPMVFNFTLDTSTSFLFGESAESQAAYMRSKGISTAETLDITDAAKEATSVDFLDAFATASDFTIYRLRLQSLYWLADGIKFRKAARTLHNFTARFVRSALAATDSERGDEKEPANSHGNLLHRLATITRDKEELRAQATAVLFAGRDTTAALICWCIMRLAQHPSHFQALRKVVLATFPANNILSFADLKGCRPLQHFISEVLRLHPSIPFNNRVANKLSTLPSGGGSKGTTPIAVAKGQIVAFSIYHMHRRKDLWGEDALQFRPERWAKGSPPSWKFLPFSGGPRICIGQQYSLIEASYLLVMLLRGYDELVPVGWSDCDHVAKGLGLTMWPREGVHVRFREARN